MGRDSTGANVTSTNIVGGLVAIRALLAGRTVIWSKVRSHTTLMTSEHVLNREVDVRAGAVMEALAAGRGWEPAPGWTG